MLIPTIIMGVLALILIGIGYSKGQHIGGLTKAYKMSIEILPMLIFAFIIAGMIQILLPKELLSNLIGEASGIRGICIGAIAGAFSPGGPYISMPIAAGLLKSGASIPTMIAFLTGWSLWAFARLPMEVGILGWKFTAIRIASVSVFPILAGLTAQGLLKIIK